MEFRLNELSEFSKKRAYKDWKNFMQDIPYMPLDQKTFELTCEEMDVRFSASGGQPA